MSSLHWGHTWLTCWCIPNDGACCDQTAAAFGANIDAMHFLQSSKQSLRSAKFDVFVFAFSQFAKIQFCRFCFFEFSTRWLRALRPGRDSEGKDEKKFAFALFARDVFATRHIRAFYEMAFMLPAFHL